MTNLVDEFFKRNLTEAESQGLEEILEKSPEEALRFGQKMEQEYLAMGLTVPRVPKHFGPVASKGSGILLKSILAVAALAGSGTLAWWFWPKAPVAASAPVEKSAIPHALARPKAKLPPPPLEVPRKLEASAQEGNRLSVVVELGHPAPVEVSILDSRDQTVRNLYAGNLQAGKWSIHWDGLLSDGSRAPSGNYQIRVKSGSREMSKNVAIEAGK